MIKQRQGKHIRSYLETSLIRKRRKRRKTIRRILLLITVCGIITGFVFVCRMDALQIKDVAINGTSQIDSENIRVVVQDQVRMNKNIFGLVPSTSILFTDEEVIKDKVLKEFPVIEEVVVDVDFDGILSVDVKEREMAALWCASNDIDCYRVDATGYIYMKDEETANLVTPDAPAAPIVPATVIASTSIATSSSATTTMASPVNKLAQDHEGVLVLKGLLDSSDPEDIIGKYYLSHEQMEIFSEIRKELSVAGYMMSNISCTSSTYCSIKLTKGGVLHINPEDNIKTVFDRLYTALKSEPLSKQGFEYIDLRFGNKLFYKLNNGKTVASTTVATSTKNTMSTTTPATSTATSTR